MRIKLWVILVLQASMLLWNLAIAQNPGCGSLCDYVHRPDGAYSWQLLDHFEQDRLDTYVIDMKSQIWYDEEFSDHPNWWHYVTINIPHEILIPDRAFLYINGGSINDGLPHNETGQNAETARYAVNTGMVTATVRQIPNQPVIFRGESQGRTEDGLIAWTWREFLETDKEDEDPDILARFPMCKGASKAMDTVIEFVQERLGNTIEKFMISGASKRGWTTWLLGAADSRVEAMAPLVLSLLNTNDNIKHYYQSLGNWPYTFFDYWMENITSWIDHPRIRDMETYIDPLQYSKFLTMPKLMVSGASDEFFMCDDYDYFYEDLLEPKFIWIQENTGHSVNRGPLAGDMWAMLETFYLALIYGQEYPQLFWTKEYNEFGGSITLYTANEITNISAWAALTPAMVAPRKDFRLSVLDGGNVVPSGVVWYEYPVENLGGGYYRVSFENPEDGFLAFFIKVTFPWDELDRSFTFSTEAMIIPNEFPFEECTGVACQGSLV